MQSPQHRELFVASLATCPSGAERPKPYTLPLSIFIIMLSDSLLYAELNTHLTMLWLKVIYWLNWQINTK